MSRTNNPRLRRYYNQLAGKTIKKVHFQQLCLPGDYYPVIEFTDGTLAGVACDEELNGPGHLDIQMPEKKEGK